MNDLLPQFVAEARDLLADAGSDLLALERGPEDAARVNRLFRSVHTLKGSSGLFEVQPLTRILHAGEDLFQALREGKLSLTPEMVDGVLRMLDQTGKWVEHLDQRECLPDDAAQRANEMTASLRVFLPAQAEKPGPAAPLAVAGSTLPQALEHFAPDILAALSAMPGTLHLVSYTPPESCFFKGEDPLHLALNIPGLVAFSMVPRHAWPAPAALDPFQCNLTFHALSAAALPVLTRYLRYVADEVSVHAVAMAALAGASALPPAVRSVLAQQLGLLLEPSAPAEQAGRLQAAAAVAANALHCATLPPLPPEACASPQALRAALTALLSARAAAEPEVPQTRQSGPAGRAGGDRRGLRVEQEKVDLLMKLVGELVVAKNSLPFLARRAEHDYAQRELGREIKDEYAVIDRIAQELQGAVMSVRMMPVGQVFQRFPRLVRDLARKLGKQLELQICGEDTAADKNVIESLFDPLLHMVRNSLDHGIESPEERQAQGKPAQALLQLRARQDGDQVVLEIIDDGRGIDPAIMRRKAFERGLISATERDAMDDEAAIMLVFAPGFSTASTVSDVSGRGVGMDVVRSTVEKAGGRIKLDSKRGQGTVVRLTLPLSMAVTRIMTIRLGEQLFGVPLDMVLETIRISCKAINQIKTAEVFTLRQRVIPLRHLSQLLCLPPAPPKDEVAVLVVQLGAQTIGLGVAAFGEVMEVILKPMEGKLAELAGYCGTALLGDGRVLLVLDLKALLL